MVRRSAHRRSPRDAPSREVDADDDIPEVYRQLMAEEEARVAKSQGTDRPLKRRRVGERVNTGVTTAQQSSSQLGIIDDDDHAAARDQQMAYDSTASDESEMEWEEVDIQQQSFSDVLQPARQAGDDDEPLQITLGPQNYKQKRVARRRRVVTAAERKLRLDVHKVHLLCLLAHVYIRNLWCNDEEVQSFLKELLPKKIIAFLNPTEDKPQFTRSTTFIDGLNQASDAFMRRFKVTKLGLKRPHWAGDSGALQKRAESLMFEAESILSKDDFRTQAKTLQGSRDLGAQLFCALLRSAGVDARLVCSLQPLSLGAAAAAAAAKFSPSKPDPSYVVISSDDHASSTDERPQAATPPPRINRLSRPQFAPSRLPSSVVHEVSRPHMHESSHPVYWVEAFNEAVQKWIPVDPFVTKSLAKTSKFEPPASDQDNRMSYVIAFDEDASARDVTRRYVKAYNAKTRKMRVESTKNGDEWWIRTLAFYEKPFLEDRDEIEIGELTAKSAAEPMPRNVQDFKGHPVYALERHLHRNQAIHPKRVIGQVGLSKSSPGKKETLEPVYRRADVHTLRSADGWYRLGRDIKLGEQPLKRIPTSRSKATTFDEASNEDEVAAETPLYAEFQTEVYRPPPVVQGRVPKNAYGNLDIYVPSMVPSGGVHVKHADAARAAKILGIDYADAVVGFDFKGRRGTAIIQGIAIAEEYRDALAEVIKCLEDERYIAELGQKSAQALRLWRHFLIRLRIAERVKGYTIEGGADESAPDETECVDTGGGFIPEPSLREDDRLKNSTEHEQSESQAPQNRPTESSTGNKEDLPNDSPNTGTASQLPQMMHSTSMSTYSASTHARCAKPAQASKYTLVVIPNDRTSQVEQPSASSVCAPVPGPETILSAKPRETLRGSQETPFSVDSSVEGDAKSVSIDFLSRPVSREPSRARSVVDSDGSEDQKDDSLMSEDPEDEDAIPEWLM